MNILQIVLLVFFFFALSRVVLRFRDHHIRTAEFFFWAVLFTIGIGSVASPNETTKFAQLLGIGRGVDLIVYASIATLFYLIFRIYVQMEDIRHELTNIVRSVALERGEGRNVKSSIPARVLPGKRKGRNGRRR